MKKADHVLFTKIDEQAFSDEIRKSFPATLYIDDMIWETSTPPTKLSITECESKFIYIWNPSIYPVLPYGKRRDGKFHGPQSGMVIQLQRSIEKDKELLSGYISVGVTVDRPEREEMASFVKAVWLILKKLTRKKLVQVDSERHQVISDRKDILIGNDAYEWASADERRYLKFHNNPFIYLRPA